MNIDDKKAKDRFLIVFLMGIFVVIVCIWSLGSLINNIHDNNGIAVSANNTGVSTDSDDNQNQKKAVNSSAIAKDILENVKFETELKKIDKSVADGMISVNSDSELNLYMGSGSFSDELIVVKSSDAKNAEADQEAVEEHLKEMRSSFEAYIPEQAKKISDAVIVRSGCYVVACVTSDTDNAKDIILSEFK